MKRGRRTKDKAPCLLVSLSRRSSSVFRPIRIARTEYYLFARFARVVGFSAGAASLVARELAVRLVVLPALPFAAAELAVRLVVLPALPFAAAVVFAADEPAAGLAARA